MGKVWIEVSLMSVRGLRRSSIWKLQWFAVGWIDPKNKYCTKLDDSGNSNPIWNTKFATLINDSSGSGLALHVEVYSREPVFLRESLLGTASVPLSEFLSKHSKKDMKLAIQKEVGSYQLRNKANSGKPLGFIDISLHISEEAGHYNNVPTPNSGGIVLMDHDRNEMSLEKDDGWTQPQLHITRRFRQNRSPGESPLAHNHNIPRINEANYPGRGRPTYQPPQVETGYPPARTMQQPQVGMGYPPSPSPSPSPSRNPAGRSAGYPIARTPPPPPPPAHVGFIPTVMPRVDNNVPCTSRGPGFGPGLGAAALAAGAVIFGDDFLSGFHYVAHGSTDPTLTSN